MLRYCSLLCLLFTMLCLNALTVIDVSGSEMEFSYKELLKDSLETFVTNRTKGAKTISESWKGIPIVPWLTAKGFGSWHVIKFISLDAYEVSLHRVELDPMPAFIAFEYQSEVLAETDIRVIFPSLRENMWLRGLQTIRLKGFETYPHPHIIRKLELALDKLDEKNSAMPIGEFISATMHQQKGTIVLLDSGMQAFSLEYPKHLSEHTLFLDKENRRIRLSLSQIGDTWLRDIIYIQCGPFAYASDEYLGNLQAIAKPLGWRWEGIKARKVQKLQQTDYLSGVSLGIDDDYRVEMD